MHKMLSIEYYAYNTSIAIVAGRNLAIFLINTHFFIIDKYHRIDLYQKCNLRLVCLKIGGQ